MLPTIEIELRDELDRPVAQGETGMIFLRGEQIAGEYATGSLLDENGWFCTKDRGSLDSGGSGTLERELYPSERARRELPREMTREPLERPDDNGGVPGVREKSARLPVAPVLFVEDVLAEVVPHEREQ